MPLSMGVGQTVDYYIDAKDDLGFFTATLGSGQTISVVSSDPATVVLTPDTTVRKAPDGTVCVASGKAASAKPPAQPGVAINITGSVLNADGTPGTDDNGAVIAPAVDTITINPGQAHALGELFGVPA